MGRYSTPLPACTPGRVRVESVDADYEDEDVNDVVIYTPKGEVREQQRGRRGEGGGYYALKREVRKEEEKRMGGMRVEIVDSDYQDEYRGGCDYKGGVIHGQAE
jgi:hypothetical protein